MIKKQLREILTSEIISVYPSTPILEVLKTMQDNNISCVLVNEENVPIGILTERGIVLSVATKRLDLEGTQVREVMSTPVFKANIKMNLYEAFNLLSTQEIRHLVVVDDENQTKGIITLSDMIEHLGFEYFAEMKKISATMTKTVVTISKDTSVHEAIAEIAEKSVSCLVIADKNLPVGILTERDLTRLLIDHHNTLELKVEDVMSRPVDTATEDSSVINAAKVMKRKKIRRLIVVNKKGKIVGLITQSDIVKGLESQYIGILKLASMEKEIRLKNQRDLLNKTIESLTHPFYVIDPYSHEILFANQATNFGNISNRPTCYALTHGRTEPCCGEEYPCPVKEILKTKKSVTVEHVHYDRDGKLRNIGIHASPVFDENGNVIQVIESCIDITERKRVEEEKDKHIKRLQAASDKINTLRGIIPICSYCKQIRDDKGYWSRVEEYIGNRIGVSFTHGICPDCIETHFNPHDEDGKQI